MSVTLWKDSYQIGEKEIDLQHYQLFQKISRLLEISQDGDSQQKKDECQDLVDYLIFYTLEHFETEEALQKRIGYVSYAQHARIHAKFKNTAFVYHKKIHEEYSDELLQNFVGTLLTWLVTHVCGCDQKIMKGEPLKSDYSSLRAEVLVPTVLKNIFTDLYDIQIGEVKPCMYKGYVEGRILIRTVAIAGEKKYSFVYGLSAELVTALYRGISGMEIGNMDHLTELESSALTELGDIITSYILCTDEKTKLNNLKMQNHLFTSGDSMEQANSRENLLLNIQTSQGCLEVLCCIL